MRLLLFVGLSLMAFCISISFTTGKAIATPIDVKISSLHLDSCDDISPPFFLKVDLFALLPVDESPKIEQALNGRELFQPKPEYIHATKYAHFLNRKIMV